MLIRVNNNADSSQDERVKGISDSAGLMVAGSRDAAVCRAICITSFASFASAVNVHLRADPVPLEPVRGHKLKRADHDHSSVRAGRRLARSSSVTCTIQVARDLFGLRSTPDTK